MRRLGFVCLLVCTLAWWPAAVSAQTVPPGSMAAIGDSITRATDTCCWYGDHPSNSWSTGAAGWDGVSSHYERLRAFDPAIGGHAYDAAAAGATMASGPGQAQLAVAQHAEYVTVMLGANDLCTSSPATMTPVDVFRTQIRSTLQTLGSIHVFVASIPNVYRLWEILHDNPAAQFVWRAAGICQALLGVERTPADRQLILDRNVAFNAILLEECAAVELCRFDGNAVFNYPFTASQVSKLDYFHPNLAGQAALAQVTWTHSWWA
jgi:lysophospholipase L1-like esterase